MLFRLAFPLIFMLGPRLLPPVIRFFRLVWRLTFDKRVPLVLRVLVPLAIAYTLSPLDLLPDMKAPFGIARIDDVIVLGLAVLLLAKLAPQHVIDEHLGRRQGPDRPEDKDPSKVVDGSSRIVEDE